MCRCVGVYLCFCACVCVWQLFNMHVYVHVNVCSRLFVCVCACVGVLVQVSLRTQSHSRGVVFSSDFVICVAPKRKGCAWTSTSIWRQTVRAKTSVASQGCATIVLQDLQKCFEIDSHTNLWTNASTLHFSRIGGAGISARAPSSPSQVCAFAQSQTKIKSHPSVPLVVLRRTKKDLNCRRCSFRDVRSSRNGSRPESCQNGAIPGPRVRRPLRSVDLGVVLHGRHDPAAEAVFAPLRTYASDW